MEMARERSVTSVENAQHSTGPKTAAGKARSAQNSRTHGLLAQHVVLKDEDVGAYLALRDPLVEEFAPVGVEEGLLAERVAELHWQYKQVDRLRTQTLNAKMGVMAALEVGGPGAGDGENRTDGESITDEHGVTRTDTDRKKDTDGKAETDGGTELGVGGSGKDEGGGDVYREEGGRGGPPLRERALLDALTAYSKEFTLMLRYRAQIVRDLEKVRKELQMLQDKRKEQDQALADREEALRKGEAALDQRLAVEQAVAVARGEVNLAGASGGGSAGGSAGAAAAAKGPRSSRPCYGGAGGADGAAATNWRDVVQQLYFAAAAGPQGPHPLRETYYGAYAIWLKHAMMVEQDIGDDDAGSHLAALSVAFGMRLAGVEPVAGQVWGAPDVLADWREQTKTPAMSSELCEKFRELVTREYARRDGTVEDAAKRIAALPEGADLSGVLGPWLSSGDMAQLDRAMKLAEGMREAKKEAEKAGVA